MKIITETIRTKAVSDGGEIVTKHVTTKLVMPKVVSEHPIIATYVAYRAGKKLGRFVRNHRNGTVHKHYYNQVSSREVAVAEVNAD